MKTALLKGALLNELTLIAYMNVCVCVREKGEYENMSGFEIFCLERAFLCLLCYKY